MFLSFISSLFIGFLFPVCYEQSKHNADHCPEDTSDGNISYVDFWVGATGGEGRYTYVSTIPITLELSLSACPVL